MEPITLNKRDEPDVEKAMDTLVVDKLSKFREQIGISDVDSTQLRTRSARNIGLYPRIIAEERAAKYEYYFTAFLINACLLLQVIFASALTALGAGSGSHTQITALGAANTVIAAVLTFTKGQGLPNKLRQYQQTLRKVREYIEQRERDFAQLDCKLDLDYELETIKRMYKDARQNDENNDPSSYHNISTASPLEKRLPIAVPQEQSQLSDHSPSIVANASEVPITANRRFERPEASKGVANMVCSLTWRVIII